MVNEKQKKALTIFQMVLELILGLFKAAHGETLRAHHSKDLEPQAPTASQQDAE